MELLRLLAQHAVGDIVDRVSRLNRLHIILDGDGHSDLFAPEGHGVNDAALELHRHILVVVLDHLDLRRGLQTACAGEAQVMHLLLELVDALGKAVGEHSVFGEPGLLSLLIELGELAGARLFERDLGSLDIHRQRLEGLPVLLIEFVKHGDVLLQAEPVTLELLFDAFKGFLGALVSGADGHRSALQLLHKVRKEAAVILAALDAVHCDHHLNQQLADLAGVFGLDVLKSARGDRRRLLLDRSAVIRDDLGLVEIDLRGKILDLLSLLLGELLDLVEHLIGGNGELRFRYGGRGLGSAVEN